MKPRHSQKDVVPSNELNSKSLREALEPKSLSQVPADGRILFQNNGLLVIDKPNDVRMSGDFDITVEKLIHYWCPELSETKLRWIHQLDYATSGVLCVGLNPETTCEACKLFEFRRTKKVYLALVQGHLDLAAFPEVEIPNQELFPLHGKSSGRKTKKRKPGVQYRPPASYFQEHKAKLQNLIAKQKKDSTEEVKELSSNEQRVLDNKWKQVKHDAEFIRQYVERSENDKRRAENQQHEEKDKETSRPQIFRMKGDSQDSFIVDAPLEEVAGDFRMKVAETGRASMTRIQVVESGFFQGNKVTKLRLYPLTGRRHQLRIHCMTAGYPIVGDATYSGDLESPRMMLHAQSIELPFEEGKGPGVKVQVCTDDPFPLCK
mmetsp:Transcript_962/g.1201  ORF Transcript_962/g.1201 Transcript_962/m.1201 type:complete len:376 (-) Transcript_962:147-1274(-)